MGGGGCLSQPSVARGPWPEWGPDFSVVPERAFPRRWHRCNDFPARLHLREAASPESRTRRYAPLVPGPGRACRTAEAHGTRVVRRGGRVPAGGAGK